MLLGERSVEDPGERDGTETTSEDRSSLFPFLTSSGRFGRVRSSRLGGSERESGLVGGGVEEGGCSFSPSRPLPERADDCDLEGDVGLGRPEEMSSVCPDLRFFVTTFFGEVDFLPLEETSSCRFGLFFKEVSPLDTGTAGGAIETGGRTVASPAPGPAPADDTPTVTGGSTDKVLGTVTLGTGAVTRGGGTVHVTWVVIVTGKVNTGSVTVTGTPTTPVALPHPKPGGGAGIPPPGAVETWPGG